MIKLAGLFGLLFCTYKLVTLGTFETTDATVAASILAIQAGCAVGVCVSGFAMIEG